MATILQLARDAVIAALNDYGSEQDATLPTFTKRRWEPGEQLGPDEIRGAVLFAREQPRRDDMRFPVARRDHWLAVQVVTAVAEPELIDDALEPARAWMVQQLGDTRLDGLIHDLAEEETRWETAKLERIHGAFTTLWRIRYQTNRSNLALRS